jgi:hypothetical protein
LAKRGNSNQSGKRASTEYAAIKKTLETKLLEGLYANFPKTRGKVEFVSIGTPLTNRFYLGRPDSYGLEHTPARYGGALDAMRPASAIPGLYLTGQDVTSVGIVGALNGGILTAHAVLGYGVVDLVLAKRNLVEDLMAAEGWGATVSAKARAVAVAKTAAAAAALALPSRSPTQPGRQRAAIAVALAAVICVVLHAFNVAGLGEL